MPGLTWDRLVVIGKRPSFRYVFAATTVATTFGFAVAVATANSTPNLCTTIGLTNAAAHNALGPTVTVKPTPNAGRDIGDCTVAHVDYGAEVEWYPSTLEPSLISSYEAKARVRSALTGLGKGAVFVIGPESPSATYGGPDVYFTAGQFFVTIVGYPPYPKQPAVTAAQLIKLAHAIHNTLG